MSFEETSKKLSAKIGPPIIGGSAVALWYNSYQGEIMWIPFILAAIVGFGLIYIGRNYN